MATTHQRRVGGPCATGTGASRDLGNPIFRVPPRAPPLPRREKAAAGARCPGTGTWCRGREDRLLPLQVGPGPRGFPALGFPQGTSSAVPSASLPHSHVHHRARPLTEGGTWGAGWGTVALTAPHIQLGPTRVHTGTGLAHCAVYAAGFPGWALSWAAATPLH